MRPAAARPPAPRVVPAGGDLQHPAHARNRILGLMRSYELVDPDGIESVSRANQAAAFDWSIYEVSDYLGCGSYGSRVVPEVECTS